MELQMIQKLREIFKHGIFQSLFALALLEIPLADLLTIISITALSISLGGFLVTTFLLFRKEKSEMESLRIDNEKKELEIAKLKAELEVVKLAQNDLH